MDEKTITQRKFGTQLKFQFGTDRLTYTLQDYSGERQFSVPYEVIKVLEPSTLVVNNLRLMRMLLWIPVVIVVFAAVLPKGAQAVAGAMVLFAAALAIFLFIARRFKVFSIKYTLLGMAPVPAGAGNQPIRIMHDVKHATILDAITARWKARLKRLYGTINLSNDLNKEIAKFSWLKEHAVITELEYHEALTELGAAGMGSKPQPPERTLN